MINHSDSNSRETGFIWGAQFKVQPTTVGKSGLQELDVAGYLVSAVGKRKVNDGASFGPFKPMSVPHSVHNPAHGMIQPQVFRSSVSPTEKISPRIIQRPGHQVILDSVLMAVNHHRCGQPGGGQHYGGPDPSTCQLSPPKCSLRCCVDVAHWPPRHFGSQVVPFTAPVVPFTAPAPPHSGWS
jgi:hypothetical protein